MHKILEKIILFFIVWRIRPKIVAESQITPLKSLPNRDERAVYLLPYRSLTDKLILQKRLKKVNLPYSDDFMIEGKRYNRFFAVEKEFHIPLSNNDKNELSDNFYAFLNNSSESNQSIIVTPISIMFGRAAEKSEQTNPPSRFVLFLKKICHVLFVGKRCFILYSAPIDLHQIQQNKMVQKTSSSAAEIKNELLDRLIYIVKRSFEQQFRVFIGPILPKRKQIIARLLNKPVISNLIKEEALARNCSETDVRLEAQQLLDEIAADYRYRMLKLTDIVLTWAWSRLYQGLRVTHCEPVREYAKRGHEIIFAPCHRSHMDYLLLSYVLYRQGLVPPHIAAGLNLNFWPAGPIFRRLGAFFIRRSFRGNKLYPIIFREYMIELFGGGYSVEYFIEGGRSRTGRLLDPKTGLLLMTVQTLLRDQVRPITIIPVYVGYEHVLEVSTYDNELKGATKQKESGWHMFKAFLRLKKLGLGYVNFGKPIPLQQFLNKEVPNWHQTPEDEMARPKWLTASVNQLSKNIMANINQAGTLNAMNLCCLILLSAHNKLTKNELLESLRFHLNLAKNVPYSEQMIIPENKTSEQLFSHVKNMGKFIINDQPYTTQDSYAINNDDTISMADRDLTAYYRNNIQHLYILPSLMLCIIKQNEGITKSALFSQIARIYPLLQAEYFLSFNADELNEHLKHICADFITNQLIIEKNNAIFFAENPNTAHFIITEHCQSSLIRYAIMLLLIAQQPDISKGTLDVSTRKIAVAIAENHDLASLEYYDKSLYQLLSTALKDDGYLNKNEESKQKTDQLVADLFTLISFSLHDDVLSQQRIEENPKK